MSDGGGDRKDRSAADDPYPSLGLARGTVELAAHDPRWREAYEREVERLRPRLGGAGGGDSVRFEHVGSTAVPGLAAKPILDLLVLVSDLDDAEGVARALEAAGYEERPDDDVPDRRFFVRGPPERRTHYLSVTEVGSDCHREQVTFRDALRADDDLAAEYERHKRRLAEAHPDDRSRYTNAKASFVESVLDDAASWEVDDSLV
ncbi:Glutamate-rich protein grpB [Haloferax gibbonsii ATCC 33959]|uniref:Glutamate-rich protein grpB n=1 Tax=Haloferax gibbonsii (strain ATCC 33959 / DSM 4427 / JCM 8863 / NBRC 102184 / NCIMB 2188 / Ma 2.38) TaxID=1227459 RepID=M0HFY9_HALGM|nr:GrpB family protein [Haloferax gibbonsii]ELZ83431.1 Glutamate-rich protein grpB [Haloferax gibbonsii ATCC 33959]